MAKKDLETAVVTCPYCGSTQMMEIPKGSTDEQKEQYIIAVCTCEKAKKEQRKDGLGEKINLLFGEGSASNGFEEPLMEDELNSLQRLCNDVLAGRFINATVSFGSGDKARITTVTDRIKITRESKTKAETGI